jgi:DNA polymerase-3 subunit gamma/tau
VLRRIAAAEAIEIDDAAVQLIARAAGGSFRDAVTTLDQLSTAQSAAIAREDVRTLLGTADEGSLFGAIDLVGRGDAAGLLRLVDELAESGTDLASFTTGCSGTCGACS